MKISLNNVLAIIAIGIAIYFGIQNDKLNNKMGVVHQNAKAIINNNYYAQAPQDVRVYVDTIAAASGNAVTLNK